MMESGESGEGKFSRFNHHISRRNVIKGAAAVGALAATGLGAREILERIRDKKEENDPKDILKDEWKEEIDRVTANHLFEIYKDNMDSGYYPNDESKQDFFNKLTQLASRVGKENDNLGNQLAAVALHETKGTFSPVAETAERSGKGIFLLTDDDLKEYDITEKEVGQLGPVEQLTLYGKILQREKERKGEDFAYNRVADLMLAKMHPTSLGGEYSEPLYTLGSDAYSKNKEFDADEDGEVTIGEIEETVKEFAIRHGEVPQFLENPNPVLVEDSDEEVKDPYADDPTDEELEARTEADMVTAPYLTKIYNDAMKDEYFTTEERKLNFMRELTRVAGRLNEKQELKNDNLANQIAAVINFETAGSFSSSVQNPGSSATGLIQFMDFIAEEYGTTCEELAKMSPLKQLSYVERYFKDKQTVALDNGWKGLWDISDVYMAVFWPAGMGLENNDVLFGLDTNEYRVNSVLDRDGDGVVLKREASESVIEEAVKRKEQLAYLYAPESSA